VVLEENKANNNSSSRIVISDSNARKTSVALPDTLKPTTPMPPRHQSVIVPNSQPQSAPPNVPKVANILDI